MPSCERRMLFKCAGALAVLALAGPLLAQAPYPNKPIRIIAPVQPGGGVDLVARTIADRLGRVLGQSIIVENQSGGGGVVGSQATARAAPDGYTLMVGYVGTHGTNPAVRKLPYDAIKDFTPIAMVGGTPNVLVVPPRVPVNTLREFIPYAEGESRQALVRIGGSGHAHPPRDGAAQGRSRPRRRARRRIAASVRRSPTSSAARRRRCSPGLAAALPHIKAGKMKPLAVTGLRRHRLLPDVPTFEELGYKGFDGVQWYGIVGPANLPPAIVKLAERRDHKLLDTPELRERLSGEALEPMPMSPEQFGQLHARRHREVDAAGQGPQHRSIRPTAMRGVAASRRAQLAGTPWR